MTGEEPVDDVQMDASLRAESRLQAEVELENALRPPSRSRPTMVGGLLLAGGAAWTSGVVAAAADGDLIRSNDGVVALLLASMVVATVLAARASFAMSGASTTAARAAQVLGIIGTGTLFFGGLFAVAATMGRGADDRVSFWLWFCGTLATAGALRLAAATRPRAVRASRERTVRVAFWGLAWIASLIVVFPPLRHAVATTFSGNDEPVTFAGPSDDDD